MSLGISKDCFPDPTECHNCKRKGSSDAKRKSEQPKDYKRCSNCHLLTYCDRDCQREHWMRVHKHHCRFLSGKAVVKNSKHVNPLKAMVTMKVKTGDEAQDQRGLEKAKRKHLLDNCCNRCVEENEASDAELDSKNSPKTICNIDEVTTAMKEALGCGFRFHGKGKKCNCSSKYACELPFSLGEVSGQYVLMETGLDIMLAHSLNIVDAMFIKCKKEDHEKSLGQLWGHILHERSILWRDILISGMPKNGVLNASLADTKLNARADALMNIYGADNPWSICLKIAVDFFTKTRSHYIMSNGWDSRSLDVPRFKNVKLVYDYNQSQLQNQAIVCEKKLWPKFMLWPAVVNNSLVVVLPDGIRCQGCFEDLSGKRIGHGQDAQLGEGVAENAAIMASCTILKNPICGMVMYFKSGENRVLDNEKRRKEFLKEKDEFLIESRECDFCFKLSHFSHRCSPCRTVQYCSTVCQKKDLDFHKTVCATWAKDKSRRILGGGKQKELNKASFAKLL